MKVIIAEDEYYSRKVLVKLLGQMDLDLYICLEAETGMQVVEYLSEHKVDLVITDIRMPEMDGLALGKYISEHYPDTDVMIESGYSDFNYAKEAISYGVRNYLTKPIRPEELEEAIRNIQKTRQKKLKEVECQVNRRVLQECMQYLTISGIMENPVLFNLFTEQCFEKQANSVFRMFLFQSRERMNEKDTCELVCFLQNKLGGRHSHIFHFHQSDEIILILFGKEEELEKNKISIRIHQILSEYGIGMNCGASRVYKMPNELVRAYRDSIYAINSRLLNEKAVVFEYQTEMPLEEFWDTQDEILLYESVVKCNYKQAAIAVEKFFQCCKDGDYDAYSLYSGIMQIFSSISKAFCRRETSEDIDGENRYLLFSFKSDLYQFRTMQSLKDYILKILKNTCEAPEEENHNMIKEIKDYVARNFRYEISLNELAAHKYFMNPSYVSRLFKAETGMNFSKYLIGYRMERAKELLENTVFKINEVADYVGYNDTSYFIHTFRKWYQVTPEQYRTEAGNR